MINKAKELKMGDIELELEEDLSKMPAVEDLVGSLDTDAMKWALAFKRVIIENNFTIEDMKDEGYMVSWFASALMTQHDWCHNEGKGKVLDSKINSLKKMIDVQKNNLTDSYMCGMANGMIFSLSILDGKDPEYVKDCG